MGTDAFPLHYSDDFTRLRLPGKRHNILEKKQKSGLKKNADGIRIRIPQNAHRFKSVIGSDSVIVHKSQHETTAVCYPVLTVVQE